MRREGRSLAFEDQILKTTLLKCIVQFGDCVFSSETSSSDMHSSNCFKTQRCFSRKRQPSSCHVLGYDLFEWFHSLVERRGCFYRGLMHAQCPAIFVNVLLGAYMTNCLNASRKMAEITHEQPQPLLKQSGHSHPPRGDKSHLGEMHKRQASASRTSQCLQVSSCA